MTILAVLCSLEARAQQQVRSETPQEMLSAQIRSQGFICEKTLGAKLDKKRSRPDRDAWVLRCSNATYRITRAPDMAAKVEVLRD
ncbi:hypothetical protein SE91_01350 [Bradyrhizobium sp. DOA1]|nr:hypothetical protein SE91_01350 [Bradyrhizobium sp. DOA1]